jgi:hypothetical protein
MSSHPPTITHQLAPRDLQILRHMARDHLTLYRVLRQRYFGGQGHTAAVKVIARLRRAGFVQWGGIIQRQTCFVLTPQAARLLGVTGKRAVPGPQSLPIDWAVLLYTSSSGHLRYRLTRSELRATYPWVTSQLAAMPHCQDDSETACPRLELIRVDLGGKPDHVARKCARDINLRRDLAGFQTLLKTGRFRLVVITTTEGKVNLIRQALDRFDWPQGLWIHLATLQDLTSLL